MLKTLLAGIKKVILGNMSDCDCTTCGYPMGCGDTAFTYAEEVYCSTACVYAARG